MRCYPLRSGHPYGAGGSFDARCGFAPPALAAGTNAQSATSFRLTTGAEALAGV